MTIPRTTRRTLQSRTRHGVLEAPDAAHLAQRARRCRRGRSESGVPTATPCSKPRPRLGCRCISEFDLTRRVGRPSLDRHHGYQRQDHGHDAGHRHVAGVRPQRRGRGQRRRAVRRAPSTIRRSRCSSWRRPRSRSVTPQTFTRSSATWLNFAPDHLDCPSLARTRTSAPRPSIWAQIRSPDDVAVANADDPVVMRNRNQTRRAITFSTMVDGDYRIGRWPTRRPSDEQIVDVGDLSRRSPRCEQRPRRRRHGLAAGAGLDGVHETLRDFDGLPHRVEFVTESAGVRWYDDSKARSPRHVGGGLGGFDSVVLIAGGRDKGLDLGPLADTAPVGCAPSSPSARPRPRSKRYRGTGPGRTDRRRAWCCRHGRRRACGRGSRSCGRRRPAVARMCVVRLVQLVSPARRSVSHRSDPTRRPDREVTP